MLFLIMDGRRMYHSLQKVGVAFEGWGFDMILRLDKSSEVTNLAFHNTHS